MGIRCSNFFKSSVTLFLTSLSLWQPGSLKADAAVMTTGCVSLEKCTLEELFDGGIITIDDTRFDSWLFKFVVSGLPRFPDASLIEIVPLDDRALNPGFRFNFNNQVDFNNIGEFDFDLSYRAVTLNNNLKIKDNSLALRDFAFGGNNGSIEIQETVRDTFSGALPGNEPDEGIIGQKRVFANQSTGEFQLSDAVEFSPQPLIAVATHIDVFGSTGGVQFNGFEQRFSQELVSQDIPEPATSLLALSLFCAVSLTWNKSKILRRSG